MKVTVRAAEILKEMAVQTTASEYKFHMESNIAALQLEAAKLEGKHHHGDRTAIGKIIAELRAEPRYIDAVRVFNGSDSAHGFFVPKSAKIASHGPDPEEAAKVAAETEAQLAELAEPEPHQVLHPTAADDEDALTKTWSRRLEKLEASMAEPVEVPEEGTENINELEEIAGEILEYRVELKKTLGYSNRDLKEDEALQRLEARLDVLSGMLFPTELQPTVDVEELRQWERRLTAKLAREQQLTAGLSPSEAKEVERLLPEIAEFKASLAAEGFTEREQEQEERVLLRRQRLAELQEKAQHDKKHIKHTRLHHPDASLGDELKQLRAKLDQHKKQLQDEQGLSLKDMKQEPELCELEARLAFLTNLHVSVNKGGA